MPASWLIAAPSRSQALDLESVALLLDAPREPTPARAMLHFVNRLAPVEFISLVTYASGGPALLEGHAFSPGARNVVGECFARYRRRYYGLDDATRIARRVRDDATESAPVVALRCGAREIPDADWREEIYEREHLTDRLTFIYAPTPRTAFSINLYRNESMGTFLPQEIERVLAVAPLLRLVHRNAIGGAREGEGAQERIAAARRRLDARAAVLSERERDVCARIACGISADGIAADLDIAPSTVVTLRKRAYLKLGIHSRLELVRLAG